MNYLIKLVSPIMSKKILVIDLNWEINLFQLDRLYSDSDVGASKTSFCYSLSIQSERQKRESDEIIYRFKKLFHQEN